MTTVSLSVPQAGELPEIGAVLDSWQSDSGPLHLHTGDLGWYSLRGAQATAQALRVWRFGEHIAAIGLLDGEDLLRLSIDPDLSDDDTLAQQIESDVIAASTAVFGPGAAVLEARGAIRLCDRLQARGWDADELWTTMSRDLSLPVEDPGIRVEIAESDDAEVWTAIHWSAFRGVPYTADDRQRFVERWNEMMSGPFYSQAQSLLGYDDSGLPVAATTVWSAGPDRPGLIEPLAVDRDQQGHGYGKAIAFAAARSLQRLGSSSAAVATPSANTAAVAAYTSAGYVPGAEVRDLRRDG